MANWCHAAECDTYGAADTEAWGEFVAIPNAGGAVYVVGTGRRTPGGDQSAYYQLFIMCLMRR